MPNLLQTVLNIKLPLNFQKGVEGGTLMSACTLNIYIWIVCVKRNTLTSIHYFFTYIQGLT